MRLLWISLRYFFAPGRKTIHTLLILCYSAGITVLLVILAIMNTLQGDIVADLIRYDSFHVQAAHDPALASMIAGDTRVESLAVFQDLQVLVQTPFSGVVPGVVRVVSQSYIEDQFMPDTKADGLMIASHFAQRYGFNQDIRITVFPEDRHRKVHSVTVPIFQVITLPLVNNTALIGYYPLEHASFVDTKTARLGIFLKDPHQIESFQQDLVAGFPESAVRTWLQVHKGIRTALKIEKIAIVFFMLLLFVVVAYCTAQMFGRSFIERYQDIALFRSMGATIRDIQIVFLGEAIILSWISGLIGSIFALFTTYNLRSIIEVFLSLRYYMQYLLRNWILPGQTVAVSSTFIDLEAGLNFTTVFSVQVFCTSVIFFAIARIITKTKEVSLLVLLRDKEI